MKTVESFDGKDVTDVAIWLREKGVPSDFCDVFEGIVCVCLFLLYMYIT